MVKMLFFSTLTLYPKQIIMLLHKDTNKISELKNDFTHRCLEPDFILGSLKCFSFSSLCKSLGAIKIKGYSFQAIFSILVSLPFLGQSSVHSLLKSPFKEYIEMKKDAFYRLKNKCSIDWREILWLFVLKFVNATGSNGIKANSPKCLVIDDSVLAKTGRFIEKVSRLWDHVSHGYVLGYKFLALTYWDGTSCIPVDFSVHREKGKNESKPFGLKKKELKKQYNKKREPDSCGYKRAKEVDISKIENAVQMIKRALKGLEVDYILMDSWFTCWAFVELVMKVKGPVHLIGMYKTATTKFDYDGQRLTYSQIRLKLGKSVRCRKLGFHYKEVIVEWKSKQVKLFFSRQGKNGKWKVLMTTDTNLSFIQMMKIYQIRWTIEVFFKEAKQLLGLGRCQSNDFDAQIADLTTTLIQHQMLTLRFRFEHYESKGELFAQAKEEIIQLRLNERLWGLFLELVKIIETIFDGVDSDDIIFKILNDEKVAEYFSKIFGDVDIDKAAA